MMFAIHLKNPLCGQVAVGFEKQKDAKDFCEGYIERYQ